MPSTQHIKNALPIAESSEQKYQLITFFKSYLKYLKKIMNSSHYSQGSQTTIFDLKKISANISLELFLQRVFSYFKCGNQAFICSLCFIDRFLESQSAKTENIQLNMKNIFKIISVALLVSTKNFDDFYYANSYYARVCGLSLQEINQLQKQFLKMIDFDVFINGQQYKVYENIIKSYKNLDNTEQKQRINEQSVLNSQNSNEISKSIAQITSDYERTNDEDDDRVIEVEVNA